MNFLQNSVLFCMLVAGAQVEGSSRYSQHSEFGSGAGAQVEGMRPSYSSDNSYPRQHYSQGSSGGAGAGARIGGSQYYSGPNQYQAPVRQNINLLDKVMFDIENILNDQKVKNSHYKKLNIKNAAIGYLENDLISFEDLKYILGEIKDWHKDFKQKIIENVIQDLVTIYRPDENRMEFSHAQLQADQLIEQCYFSPQMQEAVLTYMHRPFELNIKSGKVNNLPRALQIIEGSGYDIQLQKNALQAALEAVRLAKFVAALDVAYANPEYLFFAPAWNTKFLMPSFDSELKEQLDSLENEIKANLPREGFLMSWMPEVPQSIKNMFSINNNAQVPSINRKQVVGAMYGDDKIVSNATMESIVKNYDAFQKVTADEIANLLFKQIFIAQQADQGDNEYLAFKGEISATNYLYDHIPGVDGIIAKIQQKLQAVRSDSTKISQVKLQAHQDLLSVRKAVQTAIYVANKNSYLYLGFILPAALTKHADTVVKKLINYDEKLSRLCKDPNYGATKDDLERDTTISRITWIVGGLAFIGGLDFISGGKSSQIAGQVAQTGVEYGIVTPVKALGYGGVGAAKGIGNVGLGAVSGIGNVAVGTVKGVSGAAVDFTNWARPSNWSSKKPADKTN